VRILLISETYPPNVGGLQVHVATLAEQLSRRGHNVEVATLDGARTPAGPPVQPVASTVNLLPRRRRQIGATYHPPFPDPASAWSLHKIVTRFRPDVLHAHNWLAVSALARRKAKLVFTAHDYSLACTRRDMFFHGDHVCVGPSISRCPSCAWTQSGWAGIAVAASIPPGRRLLRPDAVIAVSDSVARRIRSRLRCPIHVVPNFVDSEQLSSEVSVDGLVPPRPFVMYAGAVGRHKGTDLLLDLWSRNDVPGAGLFMATPGPVQSPPPGVVVKALTRAEVVAAWPKALAAVVPSRWEEPCPTVLIEAMTLGVPVVASATGGIPDMVDNGLSGLLVAPGDGSALMNALNKLIGSKKLRDKLRIGGLTAARRFHQDTVVGRIEQVYDVTLSR
jgi:glycosyltransferase involved in cell wall biosynthesis